MVEREGVSPELLALIGQQSLYKAKTLSDKYDGLAGEETQDLDEAAVVTSYTKGPAPTTLDELLAATPHRVLLDIDVPAWLVPSSTPGHSHLYIDVKLTHNQWAGLLNALAEAGIIEQRYANASLERGYTALRLPWVSKADTVFWSPDEEAAK